MLREFSICVISHHQITRFICVRILLLEKFVRTKKAKLCSDINKANILNGDDCKEAAKLFSRGTFVMFDSPKHNYPKGCLLLKRDIDHRQKVFWNQAEKGSRHPYAQAICLNPGNYIQLYSMFLYIIKII